LPLIRDRALALDNDRAGRIHHYGSAWLRQALSSFRRQDTAAEKIIESAFRRLTGQQ